MKRVLLALTMVTGFTLGAQTPTPRMSLYEEFTGETCPPCAATNPGLNKILLSPTNATKVIPIKWQVPIPSAPSNTWSLYQTNKTDINWRYRGLAAGGYGYISQNTAATATSSGINSAPQGVMDGQHQWVFGAQSDHPAYISDAVIATAQSYTSAFSIDMKHDWNNASRSAVIVTVNITATAPFTATGPLVFRCVMVERLIQFSVQPGTNGEKVFEDVAIAAFPTLQSGTSMSSNWNTSQTQSFVLTCNVPSYCRKKEEISMVGFIQDDGNRKVAQAARSMAIYDAEAIETTVAPVCTSTFAPVITVKNKGINPITSMTITPYVDGVAGTPTQWTGNLAYNTTGTVALTTLNTPAVTGAHSFSCSISAINGIDFDPSNNNLMVSVPVFDQPSSTQVVEGFVANSFPPAEWTNVNADMGTGFARTTQAGGYWLTSNAVKYDFMNNNNIGDVDELYLPPTGLVGADDPLMNFDYAYARQRNSDNDKLEVKASSDCGQSWTTVWASSGSSLATAPNLAGFTYVPDQNDFPQWQTAQLTLTGMNKATVWVKFVVTNDNGNALYLDNVNLVQPRPTGLSAQNIKGTSLALYPNPASGKVQVRLENASEGITGVRLLNMLGQTVGDSFYQVSASDAVLDLNIEKLSPGLYLVEVQNGGVLSTLRLTVQ